MSKSYELRWTSERYNETVMERDFNTLDEMTAYAHELADEHDGDETFMVWPYEMTIVEIEGVNC